MTTREHLIGYRKDLADLKVARMILVTNNLDAAEVEREIRTLTDAIHREEASCLLCKKITSVGTRVNDPSGGPPPKCIC